MIETAILNVCKGVLAAVAFLVAGLQTPSPEAIMQDLRRALQRPPAELRSIFRRPEDAARLTAMAGRRGGLGKFKAHVFPAPPGFEGVASHLAVISTRQDIQEDWDMVAPIFTGPGNWILGPEILEDADRSFKIDRAFADVRLSPADSKVEVRSVLTLSGGGQKAPLFRVNENYRLLKGKWNTAYAQVVVAGDSVPSVKAGELLRVGSLIIPWSKAPAKELRVWTEANLTAGNEDSIGPEHAHVTAWWVPSAGRLPHDFSCRIVGPAEWELRSEGNPIRLEPDPEEWLAGGGQKAVAYKSAFPISFPKAMGGKYVLGAERTVNGKNFKAWQFAPVDEARAKRDVARMVQGAEFFEKTLGPWPYPGYECFDARQYYGIESYSYTLLAPNITTVFVTHEMGHTYFGGIVPSAYVHDSWNEGLTQYVDGVLLLNDRSLNSGAQSINIPVPLSKMAVAHAYGSQSYYRGAYVMRMLEAQIGSEKVIEGMRHLVKNRAGKETRWADLRPSFEAVSGQKLDWFWAQWVDSAVFPSVSAGKMETVGEGTTVRTRITLRQTGTPTPYRLKVSVKLENGSQSVSKVVDLTEASQSFVFESPFKPLVASLDGFGYLLGRVDQGPILP